jgi:transcriptional regulator GlxA family with amidase domain
MDGQDRPAERHGARPPAARRIVVVVFNGMSLGTMSFALGVFDLAVSYGVVPGLDVRVVAGEPGTTVGGGGLACEVPCDLAAVRAADVVIVPGWRDLAQTPPEPLLESLRAAHAAGGRVAGLCSGVFVLAAAGLLDDRPATTHWKAAGTLADMYPKVAVQPGVLYVDDGDVLTAGGGAAAVDLGLHLIRTAYGATVANQLARGMVVPPHRAGGQAQYIQSPLPEPDRGDPVGETLSWALGRLDQTLPVDTLARRARMSRRTFDRRFREITGAAPAAWLTHQRVLRAQHLLEHTRLPVEEIARHCGFPSAAVLRTHFRRLAGVAPTTYRDTFGPVS